MTPETYLARRRAVISSLNTSTTASALLITDEANIRWLTGLISSNVAVLLSGDSTLLVTDSRYAGPAADVSDASCEIARDVAGVALRSAVGAGDPPVAFESDSLSAAGLDRLRADTDLARISLIPTVGLVAELRTRKDPAEVRLIKQACEVSTAALAALLDQVKVGMSELMIARTLEFELARHGAEDRAFRTIAAAGPNSSVPHHSPTHRTVSCGDILKLDFGAIVGGYHADCTRTFVVGAAPTDRQIQIHELVQRSAAAGRACLGAAQAIATVDDAARSVIAEAGFAQYFTHGLGHGIGLEIHEPPLLSAATAGTLTQGNVVTVEPGIYLPGEFGVRIEDTCVVTAGHAEVLTDFPRGLIVLDR